ncbi:MAG TPA: undecaprenyl-diphosphate phosphatase [Thermoleophilaceae bacterium]|nr:undecaprenyl-diphosphate phosphatase [Thermoleophilaceae bacterium]
MALGALQGPTELLPVSSSGHLALVPELLGWDLEKLDPELRKSFEVALHTGTAAALAIALRDEVASVLASLDSRRVLGVVLTFAPAAAVAAVFERPIERRLGSARSVALAQLFAGTALALADLRPAERPYSSAGPLDHLLIGCGQAAALVPGVSRNGATLTAARLLRFDRTAASVLSRHAALPVIAGATGLKGLRLARRGLARELRVPFAVGAGAAFVSTLGSRRLIGVMDRARSYAPFAAYRMALGTAALRRLRTR